MSMTKKGKLTEERKAELLKEFDAEVTKLYNKMKRRKANKDIIVSSSTIKDPIQLKLATIAIWDDYAKNKSPHDRG